MNKLLIQFNVLALLATGCGENEKLPRSEKRRETKSETVADPVPDESQLPPRVEDLPEGLSSLTNLSDLIAQTGVGPLHKQGFVGSGIKIAVLDNGFTGIAHSSGVRLPPGVKVEDAPKSQQQNTTHGTKIAEIVYAMATGSSSYVGQDGPTMLLLNSNGYTNFKAAIDRVIAENVDMVVYAQGWDYGGNFDGRGFINKEVDRATAAGILWFNAAGNSGLSTYNGPVNVQDDGTTVTLANGKSYLAFTVPEDRTPVRIVLAWNDFDESTEYKTPQDLDLVLTTPDGRELGAGRLRQRGRDGDPSSDPHVLDSAYARETITAVLDHGTYYLKVTANNRNFDERSMLRITAASLSNATLQMPGIGRQNSVMIPADNPSVITVGATDVSYSAAMFDGNTRIKPEVLVTSLVRFSLGEEHQGTSAASAIAAGALVPYVEAWQKKNRGSISREVLIKAVKAGQVMKLGF